MSLMEEVTDRGLGWPLGVGLAIAAISAGPKLIKSARPVVKGAIKGYLAIQAKGKEMFAESAEHLQDIYAEARHEYDEEMLMAKDEEEHPVEMKEDEEKPAEGGRPSRKKKESEEQ